MLLEKKIKLQTRSHSETNEKKMLSFIKIMSTFDKYPLLQLSFALFSCVHASTNSVFLKEKKHLR